MDQDLHGPARWTDILRRHLPDDLADSHARAAVERTVQAWCPSALSCLYIECRLSREQSQVDVILATNRSRATLFGLASWDTRWAAPLEGSPIWQRVFGVARQWAQDAYPWLQSIWLEFDLDGPHAPPAPSLFVETDWVAPRTWWQRVEAVLTVLRDDHVPPAIAANVRACVESLPPGARVNYVGAMLARRAPSLRLCVSGLSNADVLLLLERHGWTGDRDHLARTMAGVARARDGHRLPGPGLVHLDVGERLNPVIGIEYVFSRRCQIDGRLDERGLLDYLVDEGLADSRKRDAMLRWPGHSLEQFGHELWPTVVSRRINNIKLVFGPGPSVFAKGYLCARNRLRRARGREMNEPMKEAS
jgi:hypothetical protein